MEVPRDWNERLWEGQRVCALNVWNTPGDTNLLDVLYKKCPDDNVTVVGRAGSMAQLGLQVIDALEEKISDGLKGVNARARNEAEVDKDDERLPVISIVMNVKSSSNFVGKLISGENFASANASHHETEKDVKCEIRDVTYKKVQNGLFHDVLLADPPSWTPDLRKLDIGESMVEGFYKGVRELWIITEIWYCTMIVVARDWSCYDGAGLKIAVNNIVPAVDANYSVKQTKAGSWELTANELNSRKQPFPFAFKAMRLEYDGAGKLVRSDDTVGTRNLERRGDMSSSLSDPETDPESHMGGLLSLPIMMDTGKFRGI